MILPCFALGLLLCQSAPAGEQGEAEVLVARIRDNLRRIDEQLLDAADADDVSGGLEGVRQSQVDVVRDLEELIKQMKYQRSPNSSSGGGSGSSRSQPPPAPRPSDGQQQSEGEQPQSPQERGDQQRQDGEQSEGEQQGEQRRPEDGAAGQQSPQQQDGGMPPQDPLGDFTRQDTDDRWGLLPPKLQERLLNLHVDDVPDRYRGWLEAYIHSVRRLESKSSP